MTPKVSVLVPVYRVERYIEQCLRSLLSNTIINDCEVILVDDCSPDKSMEVVIRVLKDFPAMKDKVLLHSHDSNRGSAAARSTGLLQAQGRYIICVDSDDWVEPDYLERLYNEAERTGADVVGCDLVREFGDKSLVVNNQFPQEPAECLRGLLEGWVQGWLHVKLIRRALLVEHTIDWVEGLDMWEDVLLSAKVFVHAQKIAKVDKVLYHYRCNPDSIVNNVSESRLEQIVGNVGAIEDFLTAKGMPQAVLDLLPSLKARVKAGYVIFSADREVRRSNRSLYQEHDKELYRLPCSIFGKLHIFCYLHGFMRICDFLIFMRGRL
ncbi:MAG: glycosyltransferase family 2 protein [Spirochaetaceae bacterium]|nr:glycosyltransferase family 2 protein [Spirochaetaceae bacterium]